IRAFLGLAVTLILPQESRSTSREAGSTPECSRKGKQSLGIHSNRPARINAATTPVSRSSRCPRSEVTIWLSRTKVGLATRKPMPDILHVLHKIEPTLPKTACRQLHRIVLAMRAMTGRIPQLGISRWTQKGGSYRTIQRFFHTTLDWSKIQWLFFENFLFRPD